MQTEFWLERWAAGETPWQLDRVNPLLEAHADRLGLAPGKRVLVPLCGQTLDLLWLRDQGCETVGVELSAQCLDDFLAQHDLAPGVIRIRTDAGYCDQLPGLTLHCADWFDLDAATLGPIDAIWDRAALVALPDTMRPDYVRQLRALTPNRPPLLCWTLEYDQQQMPGPPFSVWPDELETLLGGDYRRETLLHRDALPRSPAFEAAGLTALHERLSLLTAGNQLSS